MLPATTELTLCGPLWAMMPVSMDSRCLYVRVNSISQPALTKGREITRVGVFVSANAAKPRLGKRISSGKHPRLLETPRNARWRGGGCADDRFS